MEAPPFRTGSFIYPHHAGQYKHLKDAEGYAARLREIGDRVEIREVTMYDVIVTGRCKK